MHVICLACHTRRIQATYIVYTNQNVDFAATSASPTMHRFFLWIFTHMEKKFNNNPNNIDFPEFGSPLHAFHTPYHMLSTQHIRHNVGG
jgi:hypothetical protein